MSLLDDIAARGAQIRERVHELAQGKYSTDIKTVMVVGYVALALQLHKAIWLLTDAKLYGAAFALVRPVFDAWLRALWINGIATPEQVEQASQDELPFPSMDKMLAAIKPVYFSKPAKQDANAQADDEATNHAAMVDRLFHWLTPLWRVLHSYTHPGARQLARQFTADQVKPSFTEREIAQGLNLPSVALIFLMGPFFISIGKQAAADEVHALALQYFAEFNERLTKGQ